jgi:PAS domain S-box-containing protein
VNVTERVRVAEELRKSEAIFRRLYDESPFGAAFVGLDYRYLRVNDEFCRITGYSPEELTSMTIMDITQPEDLNETEKQARALTSGEIDQYQIDKRYIRKDGSVVWVRLWASLLRDRNGKPMYYLPLFRDITQEKQAQQELEAYREHLERLVRERTAQLVEANAQLRLEVFEHERADEQLRQANNELTGILSSISDGFFALNTDMVVTYFNKAAEQLLNVKAENIVGRNLLDYFPEARGTIFEENYARAIREKAPIAFEAYLEPHKNWYDVRVFPYRDGVSVYFQITNARRQAEDALRESEEKLRLITNSLPVLISYVDSTQRYRFNNKGYQTWFGHTPEDIKGKHLRDVLGDAAYQRIRPYVEMALSGRVVTFENSVDCQTTGQKYVEVSYIPHIDRRGGVQGFFALVTDIHERKKAEVELKRLREEAEKERDRLTALLNVVSDEVWFCDTNGNVTLMSWTAEKAGFAPEDVNQSLSEWLPTAEILNPDGRPRPVEDAPLLRSLRGEIVRHFEEIVRVPHSGLWRFREGSSTPLRNRDGQIVGAVAAIRDVTDQKRAEIALRESEARLRTAVESLPFDFFIIGNDGRYVMQNTTCKKRWGDLIGKRPEELGVSESNLALWESNNERAFRGETVQGEVRLKVGAEEGFYYNIVAPIVDRDEVRGILGVNIDITERKKSEEALQESEAKLRLVTDSLPAFIGYVDSEEHFQFNNKAYEAWLGLSRARITGRHVRDVLGDTTYECIRPHIQQALAGRLVRFETRLTHESGRQKYVEATYVPDVDEHGKVQGFFALVNDIDERKKAEEALRESESRYRELSEHLEDKVNQKVAELKQAESLAAIGRMVSVVAHEVRNPLQSIGMGVDILKMELEHDEERKEVLEEVNYGVNTLNRIINELLNYSRPMKLEPALVRVEDLVEESVSLVIEKMKDISLSIKLEQPEHTIVADPMKLLQVLVNLISNAVDAMPDGGNLTVHASIAESGNLLRLSISDTGRGIDPQNMEQIFEPFFTTKARGTGLGLPLCKKIIEAHRGTICITSTVGEGTTAEIELPLSGS